MEVASPGISRNLKDNSEFEIFRGRGIRLLKKDDNEWIAGLIEGVSAESVTLKQKEAMVEVPFDDIRKAKLDYTQEVD